MFETLFEIIRHKYFLIGAGGLFTASLCGNCFLDIRDDLCSDFVEDNTLEERSYRAEFVEAEEEVKNEDRDHFPSVDYGSSEDENLEEVVLEESCVKDSNDVNAPEIYNLKGIKKGEKLFLYGRVSDEESGLSYVSAVIFKRDVLQQEIMDELNGIKEFELDHSYLKEIDLTKIKGSRFKVDIYLSDCSGNNGSYSVICRKDGYCKLL